MRKFFEFLGEMCGAFSDPLPRDDNESLTQSKPTIHQFAKEKKQTEKEFTSAK